MLVTLVAIDMGYGHLRPAHALARELGGPVLEADRPPLAPAREEELWARVRRFYEGLSRWSARFGGPLRGILDGITHIPELDGADLSAPNAGARVLDWLTARGLGAGLARYLEESATGLLTTFYAPAVCADVLSKAPVACVVTDADINRVWVPSDSRRTRVRFFAPSRRVVRRLTAYGVPPERITLTGFPLPPELIGGRERTALRKNLAARLVRLDPNRCFIGPNRAEIEAQLGPLPEHLRGEPPHITFAVGGAGAQATLAEQFLASLREPLRSGRLRMTLVAGVRTDVAERFRAALAKTELDCVPILVERDLPAYLDAFNLQLSESDVLWTKPSEMSFFAALGLPLLLSAPVGAHEAYNRRWVLEAGAGVAQGDPRAVATQLSEWIADGTLAAAAWSGATRLPNLGVYEIADAVRRAEGGL